MKKLNYFLTGFLVALSIVTLINLFSHQKTYQSNLSSSPTSSPREDPSTPFPEPIVKVVLPTPRPTPAPSDPLTEALDRLSTSDEVTAIETDLNQTDFASLDQELPEIESLYANLTNQQPFSSP